MNPTRIETLTSTAFEHTSKIQDLERVMLGLSIAVVLLSIVIWKTNRVGTF